MLALTGLSTGGSTGGGSNRNGNGNVVDQSRQNSYSRDNHNRPKTSQGSSNPVKNNKMEATDLFAMLQASGLLPPK